MTIVFVISSVGYQPVQSQVGNDLINRLENAATLIRDNRLAEAERQLDTILKSNLNQPDALNLMGAIRAQQRRLDEAEKLFSRAVRASPGLVSARMNLAQLYMIQGKPLSAIPELNEILRLEPNNEQAFDSLNRLLLAENRFDEFINLIEQSKTLRSLSPAVLISVGALYLEKRNADKAEENFRLALEQQADNADAILGLAQAALLRGDRNLALVYLTRAKKSTASSPETLYRFALVASGAGNYEEANAALTQALKLKPNEPLYVIELGKTWLAKPDLIEAEQAFRNALQLQPDNALTQMFLGYTLLQQKKYPEARALLEESAERAPGVPETSYYLGLISQEEGQDQQAILLFTKAVRLLPSFAEAHVGLGQSYLKLKDYLRARSELEIAVKLNPDDPQAHYQLAVLYARLKEPRRAEEEMQIVERLKAAALQKKRTQSTTP